MSAEPFQRACRRCGECCRIRGFVRIRTEDVDRIAAFLGMEPRPFVEEYARLSADRRTLELNEKENGECVFLMGNDCAIHPVKPGQCRTFPSVWRYPGAEEICPACRQSWENPKSQIPNPKIHV